MKRLSGGPIALLIASVLSGCLGGDDAVVARETPLAGTSLSEEGPAPGLEGARALPVDSWGSEMLVPIVPPLCDPAKPWVCDFYLTGAGNLTGTFTGSGPILAQHHWDPATNSVWARREMAFTGSVADCGTGSMTLVAEGHIFPDADGGARFLGTAFVAPGSTSTGLAGLVEFQGTVDQPATPAFDHQPFAHFTGTLWCI